MDSETIELLLKVGGQESLTNLEKSLANNRALLEDLTERFRRGDIAADEFSKGAKRLSNEIDREAVLVNRLAEAHRNAASAAKAASAEEQAAAEAARKAAEAAAEAAKSSSAKAGRAILDIGRSIQDFAQGGVGAILNNMEGLARGADSLKNVSKAALLGPAGLAGIATAAATLLYVATPHIIGFFKAITSGSNDIPEATDRLQRWGDKLEGLQKRLKDLQEQHHLTNSELEEYNRKTAEQARLTAELAKAKEAQAAAERMAKAPTDRQQQLAAAMAGALKNRDAELLAAAQRGAFREQMESDNPGMLGAMNRRIQRANAALNRNMEQDPGDWAMSRGGLTRELAAARAAFDEHSARVRDYGTNMADRAMKGDESALGALVRMLPDGDIRNRVRDVAGRTFRTPDEQRRFDVNADEARRKVSDLATRGQVGLKDFIARRRPIAQQLAAQRKAREEEAREAGRRMVAEPLQRLQSAAERWGKGNKDRMKREKAAAAKASRDAASAAAKASRAAARDADPSNQLRARTDAQQDDVSRQVLRQADAAGIPRAYSGDLQALARQATADLGANNGDVVRAIAQAAREGYQEAMRKNRADLMQLYSLMHQSSQSSYGFGG